MFIFYEFNDKYIFYYKRDKIIFEKIKKNGQDKKQITIIFYIVINKEFLILLKLIFKDVFNFVKKIYV